MDGLTFLKQLMSTQPIPVIIISSLAQSSVEIALEALKYGAVDVLAKPSGPIQWANCAPAFHRAFVPRPMRNCESDPEPMRQKPFLAPSRASRIPKTDTNRLIAIGASTGGTEAIAALLTHMPAEVPPILITQHIPPMFSRTFAQRLDKLCRMEVREAVDGDVPRAGLALVAPGGFHMVLEKAGAGFRIRVKDGPMVCYQRPSVDVLFTSVAMAAGASAVGVILTGMGNDGAQGMKRMKEKGCHNIAQDEASCVIFGMPREAIRAGAVDEVLPLDRIAQALLQACAHNVETVTARPSTSSPHRLA